MRENIKNKYKSSRIGDVFKSLKEKDKKAFIPFITGGFPDMQRFKELFLTLQRCGADIIEIGIPFSDPLADGPVVQKSSMIALEKGVNADMIFKSVSELRERCHIPIVLMTYFNIVYSYGFECFLINAKMSGADGIIIPDLPIEEFYSYKKIFRDIDIDNIMLACLNSDEDRLKSISHACRGFLYCVSVKGVTGIRDEVSKEVIIMLKKLKSITDLPLCAGFGISRIQHIESLKEHADGIIIGSKLISMILDEDDFNKGLKKVETFACKVSKILKNNNEGV